MPAKPKPDLAEAYPLTQLRSLIDLTEHHNSDWTQIVCRDLHEHVTAVGLVVRGSEAAAVAGWPARRKNVGGTIVATRESARRLKLPDCHVPLAWLNLTYMRPVQSRPIGEHILGPTLLFA